MTEYEKRINKAMNEVKKKYGHECIFSGHHEETIIGAHIFKRSSWPERAAWSENIVPLSPFSDSRIENIEDPWKRICLILLYVHESHRNMVYFQMMELVRLATAKELERTGCIS